MAGLKLITPPAAEPVTKNQVKPQLRIDLADDTFDTQIDALIKAAREWCEGYQNRAFISQTYDLALDAWPCGPIRIPRPPLASVASVKYTDQNGVESTWAPENYLVDEFSQPAEIWPDSGRPSVTLQKVNGIVIRFTAGYPPGGGETPDPAANVPEKIKQAIILLVCEWFDKGPDAPVPQAVKSLLDLDRVVPV